MDIEALLRYCHGTFENGVDSHSSLNGSSYEITSSPMTSQDPSCNMSVISDMILQASSSREMMAAAGFVSDEFDAVKRPALAALVIGVYSAVLVLGVFGNGLVFVTVVKNPLMRTSTNVFIANLALADIFVCAFDLPLNLYYQLADDWIFGSVLCHIIPAVFGVVVCASTLTLTVIAADRFALIVVGVRERMSPQVALLLVTIIAVISSLMSLPVALFSRLEAVRIPELGINRQYCIEVWPSGQRHIRHLYAVGMLAVQHFLPLVIIGVLYLLIFQKVSSSRKQTGRRRVVSNTNKMLVAVVGVFAIAWTPYQLFSIISEFRSNLVKGPYFKFIDLMLRVVAMASSGLNPILYGWMNANFRSAFLGLLRRKKPIIGTGNSIAIPSQRRSGKGSNKGDVTYAFTAAV